MILLKPLYILDSKTLSRLPTPTSGNPCPSLSGYSQSTRVPEKQQALTIHLCSRTFLPGMPSVSQNKVPAPPGLPPLLKMDLRDHSLSHLNFVKSAQVNAKFFYVQYFGLILCYTEYFLTAGFFIFSSTITCLN